MIFKEAKSQAVIQQAEDRNRSRCEAEKKRFDRSAGSLIDYTCCPKQRPEQKRVKTQNNIALLEEKEAVGNFFCRLK